ncbi:hypothetical protein ABZ642_45840 [Streptomyces sp. NPDC007157]|uniref:hypothetical protein n=1 Tax=Streptomyces sp. NPDC007157 TaxID=3154681 RepID=UPI0033F6D878
MTDQATSVIVSAIVVKAFALLTLWLRLHWRARCEQQRQRYLLRIAETVAPNGQVELDDRDGDGHRLQVKITRTPVPREDQAA